MLALLRQQLQIKRMAEATKYFLLVVRPSVFDRMDNGGYRFIDCLFVMERLIVVVPLLFTLDMSLAVARLLVRIGNRLIFQRGSVSYIRLFLRTDPDSQEVRVRRQLIR